MKKEESHKDHSDEDLMTLFINTKRAEIFTMIYQRYFKSLVKYLFWLSNNSEAAKDITQNVFIKIYNRPHLFDTSKNFKVWLLSIAKNEWKNYLRKKSNQSKLLKEVKNTHLPILEMKEDFFYEEKFQKIKRAINLLSENHQEVIILKYSNNLTIKEIAEVLDCSEGTIKSRLFYALKNLKEVINYEYK